ncbi:sensor histidine kinase [Rheinheimera mangrovi]|uniref:sensor histidine kinase n=1 Tax=Rheinheimera mangrovi TaxID=2498451 RepID=UPI000F8C8B54|nr:sensor histidine kinase [Rheinheimera mangrovi]
MIPEKKILRFSVESAILRELGEQLVSRPDVALTELIKNAYDADSPDCHVKWDRKRIVIVDTGHGMTLTEFKSRWMRIATGNKGERKNSTLYNRKLTGSKGIGRFAVRFLGHRLTLITIAKDPQSNTNTKLIAFFNWKKLDEATEIENLEIRYKYYPNVSEATGTTLCISDLRYEPNESILKQVRSSSLKMVSPIKALLNEAPDYIKKIASKESESDDPGFTLSFDSNLLENETSTDDAKGLSEIILSLSVSKVNFHTETISDGKNKNNAILHINVSHELKQNCFSEQFPFINVMGCDIYGSIHYFPLREGVFLNKPVDGNVARAWVKENSGVAVFDKGFRVVPYGQRSDDWLNIDADTSKSARKWRTARMEELFPITSEEMINPGINPMLAIPESHQIVGGIFVEASDTRNSLDNKALSPTMDRQGFLENEGFHQLYDTVRFAVELIAKFDRQLRLELKREIRKKEYEQAWDDIDRTIEVIESVPSLSSFDKARLTNEYQRLRSDYVRLNEHDRESRENLVTMGLLGVVAGFMTHEYQSTLHELELAQQRLLFLSKQHPELKEHADKIASSIESFNGYIDYTQAFISSTHSNSDTPYKVLAQIRSIKNTFAKFREERNIEVDISGIDPEMIGPNMPVAMYKGIVHNLYSNAIKALADHKSIQKTIKISAYNSGHKHILTVCDNGPGIPAGVRALIWDPLFTTTSNQNNPLGSGMGLGLSLVKKLVMSKKGTVGLVEPPEGFSTCFHVELPTRREDN